MRGALLFFVGLTAGIGVGIGAGYARWHEPFDPFARQRWAILNRADDAPKGTVLLLGDSLMQRLYMPTLCGRPVFNAGMAGARTDQIAPFAQPLIAKLKPSLVIVAAGANDREAGMTPDLSFAPAGAIVIGRDILLPEQRLPDGLHLSAEGRAELKHRIEAKVCG